MSAPEVSPCRPRRPRRLLVAVVGLALFAGLVQAPVAGDEIDDTRSEAVRIADRIEDLRHEAEVNTEAFLDARLAREQLDGQIAEARGRAEESAAQLDTLRAEVRQVAVESYMSDGSEPSASGVMGSGDATDVSRRRGYARSVGADSADLMDQLRGTEVRAEADARALDDLQAEAAEAEEEIARAREETEARLAELRGLQQEVQGRLAGLVEAEQERREREAEARAAEAQAAAQAEAAAAEAAAPEPSKPDPEAPTADGPTSEDADDAPAPDAGPAPAPDAAPAAPAPPAASGGAAAAIAAARSVLGTPYQWGGESPSEGFDCSGLIKWAWAHGGKSLPHSSRALYSMSAKIPVSALQPGDLVFYNSPISHVGLYIGGGQMIHSPHTGDVVKISSIHYWSALRGGGRI